LRLKPGFIVNKRSDRDRTIWNSSAAAQIRGEGHLLVGLATSDALKTGAASLPLGVWSGRKPIGEPKVLGFDACFLQVGRGGETIQTDAYHYCFQHRVLSVRIEGLAWVFGDAGKSGRLGLRAPGRHWAIKECFVASAFLHTPHSAGS
jgi:hypothetical protein